MPTQADSANGANLLTITGGHTIDALCPCLGEFRELAASVVSQRDRIPLEETGELIAKTSPDQLVVNGIVGDGAVASFQIRGGMNRGTAFLFEIHGVKGDLQLTATSRASMQRQELKVKGARGDAKELAELPIPGKYRWVPEGVASDSRYNVAQFYARLADSIRDGRPLGPGFDAAVTRHRLLDAIELSLPRLPPMIFSWVGERLAKRFGSVVDAGSALHPVRGQKIADDHVPSSR